MDEKGRLVQFNYLLYIIFFFRVGRQASTGTGGQADGQAD